MPVSSLIEKLKQHRTVGAAPVREIEWIAAHSKLHLLSAGEILTPKCGPVSGLHIVLSGHITIHVDGPTGRRKVMEWRGGDVTGVMPYSRIVAPPGDVVVEEPAEVCTVLREDLPEMIRECPDLTAAFVHIMLDRARAFTSSFLQDEKMISLGKLAAGLAHELNNPASALKRSASTIDTRIFELQSAARVLGAAIPSSEELASIEELHRACLASEIASVRSPLEQEEREGAFAAWLKAHGAGVSAAEALADTDITLASLDQLARTLPAKTLDLAICWIAADSSTQRLTEELRQASTRIYDLVDAVKGFTQMDRASLPDRVDVVEGLSDTMVVLRSKAKGKGVTLSLDADSGLPAVTAFAGELNQIWSNLIDNALDAVAENGRVELTVACEGSRISVRVVDNGCGIPAEALTRIFDPFFTTKPVGQGTGLGLDIVRRLVQRNNGQIETQSRPGRTEFCVRFPVAVAVS